ncbi:MAG TPA: methylated-DNA--[protein]-cysteine S-methyltransferase [Pseudonocardia sp.]
MTGQNVRVGLAWTVVPAPDPAAPAALRALTLAVTEHGVALVHFGSAAADGGAAAGRRAVADAGRRLGVEPVADPERCASVAGELSEYLAGRRRRFDQPVDWRLTSGDQRTVLTALHAGVGYGATVTYGELAVRSGAYRSEHRGLAARRVGAIMGSNPVPVVVPCHRVLAADGLGGFGGGLPAKRWLLELEGALPPTLDLWPG